VNWRFCAEFGCKGTIFLANFQIFSRFFTTFAPVKTVILDKTTRFDGDFVATIGCFDGVHLGHQLLLRTMLREAKSRGLVSMVITFDRQPREVFDPDFCPQLLSTPQEKEYLLSQMSVDILVVLPFTRELASRSAREFMQQVLCKQLSVSVLVAGYDNRFGRDRREGFEDYVRYGRELGIDVIQGEMERLPGDERAVSSSVIRQLLEEGCVEQMPSCLTRLYSLTGKIVAGEHIGHELGFPTANLEIDHPHKLIPAPGAYAVWAEIGGEQMPAMMNIGMRPTFDGTRQTLEVHILKQIGDVYGQMLTVTFVARLRSEQRFGTREELVAQLQQDREHTLRILDKK
jgi:riboflavin kinase/FMN adenylyltransferase